jgi:hypothetical protein
MIIGVYRLELKSFGVIRLARGAVAAAVSRARFALVRHAMMARWTSRELPIDSK